MHRSTQFFKIVLEAMQAKQLAHHPNSFFIGANNGKKGYKLKSKGKPAAYKCLHWEKLSDFTNKICSSTLAGVARWVGHQSANQKVAGSVLGQGHMPGLWARSLAGAMWETTDRCFSHTSMSLLLSFSLPFSPSKNKQIKPLKKDLR